MRENSKKERKKKENTLRKRSLLNDTGVDTLVGRGGDRKARVIRSHQKHAHTISKGGWISWAGLHAMGLGNPAKISLSLSVSLLPLSRSSPRTAENVYIGPHWLGRLHRGHKERFIVWRAARRWT